MASWKKKTSDRRLWQILDCLEPGEKESLADYLKQQPEALALYPHLYLGNPQTIWAAAFPGKSYQDPRFRKLLKQIQDQAERFLIMAYLENRPHDHNLLLLKALNQRKAGKLFSYCYGRAIRLLEKNKQRDRSYFRFRFEMDSEAQNYGARTQNNQDMVSKWQALYQHFHYWSAITRLELANKLRSVYQIKEVEITAHLSPELIQWIEKTELPIPPVLELYHRLLKIQEATHPDPNALIQELKLAGPEVGAESLREITVQLLNLFIRRVNQSGLMEDGSLLTEVYKYAYEQGVLLVDGHLHTGHFRNLITLLLVDRQYEAAAYFLQDGRAKLDKGQREKIYSLASAQYEFYARKDYSTVLKVLRSQRFEHIHNELLARTLILQCQWGMGILDKQDAFAQIKNLRTFIRRQKKLALKRKERELRFLSFWSRFIQSDHPDTRQKLISDLQSSAEIDLRRNWLLMQCYEKGADSN